jgi:hypothetical protein
MSLHLSNEAIAMAIKSLDDLLGTATITHRLAYQFNGILQRGIADELLRPHLLEQLVLGNNAVAMFEQIDENLEHFRAQSDGLARAI